MPFFSSQIMADVLASRPSAVSGSGGGQIFFATDTKQTFRNNGTGSWVDVTDGVIAKYTTSWTAQTSVTVTHNLGTTAVLVQVYDASGVLVAPESVTVTSSNAVTLTFGAAFTGSVVVMG